MLKLSNHSLPAIRRSSNARQKNLIYMERQMQIRLCSSSIRQHRQKMKI
jgi:hypothetical protein